MCIDQCDPKASIWAAVGMIGWVTLTLGACDLEAIPLDGGVEDGGIENGGIEDGGIEAGSGRSLTTPDDGTWSADAADASTARACRPGDVQTISCPHGEEIVACECRGREWLCTPSPESACPSMPCDDGNALTCEHVRPTCPVGAAAAVQGGCWQCVSPESCRAWGEPGCETDAQCPAAERCDPCGTTACPDCDDCVAACLPHGCQTDPEPQCDTARPDCPTPQISVIREGCWQCVEPAQCESDPSVPTGSCEDAGGYCEHRRASCRDGFEEASDLDCGRGQSTRCCRPEERAP